MPYSRPDLESVKAEITSLIEKLNQAEDYAAAREAFLEMDKLDRRVETQLTLVSIRHSIDTRDEFYDKEQTYWNEKQPELQEYVQKWTEALLESPFRKEFSEEYGDLMFINAEIALKTFRPSKEFISALQKENELTNTYEKLLASAQIPFEEKI